METLKQIRLAHHFSVNEVAQALHLMPSSYVLFEEGFVSIPVDKLFVLSALFQCSCHELFFPAPHQILTLEHLNQEQIHLVMTLISSLKGE